MNKANVYHNVNLRYVLTFFLGFAAGLVTVQWTTQSMSSPSFRTSDQLPTPSCQGINPAAHGNGTSHRQGKNEATVPKPAIAGHPDLLHANDGAAVAAAGVGAEFERRRLLLERGCRRYRQQRKAPLKRNYTGEYFYEGKRLLYCPIEKTGCTEWKMFLKKMTRSGVKVERKAKAGSPSVPLQLLEPFRASDVRFLFVREPYGRLVSGYVDKLMSPNVPFWSSLGRSIVKRFRKEKPSELSLRCGHDVTFAEFIDYVVDSEHRQTTNGHFSPQFKHCHVCDFPYSHVGHMETLGEDRQFILDAVRSPVNYTKDYQLANLRAQAGWYIRDKAKYNTCLSVDEALRRLWQKLKMRGHLDKGVQFPLSPQQSENVTVDEFVAVAGQAIERSREKAGDRGLGANRRETLVEAFASVSEESKLEIQTLFRWDFELFGYDPHPSEVFGRSGTPGKKYFAFSD